MSGLAVLARVVVIVLLLFADFCLCRWSADNGWTGLAIAGQVLTVLAYAHRLKSLEADVHSGRRA